MYKVTVDCLILDRGVEEQDRFRAIVSDGEELVDDNGATTELGKQKVIGLIQDEAVESGAKGVSVSGCVSGGDVSKYSNDLVEAFNAGDLIFGDDLLINFMLDKGLLVDIESLKVNLSITTGLSLRNGYKQPVVTIVNLLIQDIIKFITEKFAWAKNNEYLIRAIVKLFAGANQVDKYADKIFTEVKAKI